ncbi:TPA: hypothetical protein EYN98_33980 [Candidatus Poribacteria bacterium]|jgi:ectoine hydroxylase-related dioxygenase (phytanoyl-CoA dioxygenase family)|nr:hypothetical protein [Candidatus Poribacteria bacterium]HIA70970.1 hypothetical protein [Candidatus Poribacteria bacterium]HIB89151.1 hypothetical protein [Candidatus Poribacteria bacterium]HIC01667.1 hypothetical protein [Candidatus Poribacteria bacterium]HIM11808.1 hypothetical protein [Candidatus Poribacteria bacterium]
MQTDIQPTMNDDTVMDFIASGYVVLEEVISKSLNQECKDLSGGGVNEFVQGDDFRQHVLLHPQVAGIARSLLGKNFLVPISAHHHLFERTHTGQTWHSDGLSEYGYGVNHLQCYYYPQQVKIEDGPTMVLPGSHHRLIDREAIAHYGDILGQVSLTVPAGTVVLTHYGIWHKAGPKLNNKRRGMIKFSYFRNALPKRDWNESDTEKIPPYRARGRHPYVTEVESYRNSRRRQLTWNWLCGVETPEDVSRGAKLFISAKPLNEIKEQRT